MRWLGGWVGKCGHNVVREEVGKERERWLPLVVTRHSITMT